MCGVCLDSLKAATAGSSMEGDASGGPNRNRRQGGGRGYGNGAMHGMQMPYPFMPGARFSPYGAAGGQMVMVDPRMMAAYGGGGGMGAMTMPPFGGGGRGKNRTWSRDGTDGAEVPDVDTSGIQCIFFQRGSCRAGDACKYSHAGEGAGTATTDVSAGTEMQMNE